MVTLLTDFGYIDGFAGIMKGVIKRICTDVEIVDLTHGISSQDVVRGAMVWQAAYPYFPAGTVHVGVVDPGVGSTRRAIAVEAGDWVFVCPDNGLLEFIASEVQINRVVAIENPTYMLSSTSRTFHGRDVFAPAAAHIAAGIDLDELGPQINEIVRLESPQPVVDAGGITAHIVYFDIFGNAYTNLTEKRFLDWRRGPVKLTLAGKPVIGPVDSYASAEIGTAAAVFASHGRLEIAVRNGNARTKFGVEIGDTLRIDAIDGS